jgi:hypothetical protein
MRKKTSLNGRSPSKPGSFLTIEAEQDSFYAERKKESRHYYTSSILLKVMLTNDLGTLVKKTI